MHQADASARRAQDFWLGRCDLGGVWAEALIDEGFEKAWATDHLGVMADFRGTGTSLAVFSTESTGEDPSCRLATELLVCIPACRPE